MRGRVLSLCLLVPFAVSTARAQSSVSFQLLGDDRCPLDSLNNPTACFSVGGAPLAVTTAEFNNDGKTDVATANNDSGDVTVLIGRGDGTFEYPGITLVVSDLAAPAGITAADFDNANGLDIVVADEMDTVSVFLNQGVNQGVLTFGSAITTVLPTGTSPEGIVAGKFNSDEFVDVAVVGNLDDTVTILLGTGDGHFTIQPAIQVGIGPIALVAVDLDDTGTLDLVTANQFGGPDSTGSLTVLKGNGDGTFVVQSFCSDQPTQACSQDNPCSGGTCTPDSVLATTFAGPVAIAAGDLGNGKLGVAVANEDEDSVTVLLGNGDLTFSDFGGYTVSSVPEGVAIADFDGDGNNDIATSGSFDDNVAVLAGLGSGIFGAAQLFDVGSGPFGIAVGGLNSPVDGPPDIVTANSEDDSVSVLLNTTNEVAACTGDCNSDGRVTVDEILTMVNIALETVNISACTAGDANMDGRITIDEILTAENYALTECPQGM